MKLIIAGSRTLNPGPAFICSLITHFKIPTPKEVVSGRAKGVDTAGERWAKACQERDQDPYHYNVKEFPANWNKYGKSAGYRRNEQMADYADALLLIWDGESRGSMHMKNIMSLDKKKPVYEVVLRKENV